MATAKKKGKPPKAKAEPKAKKPRGKKPVDKPADTPEQA